jgi:DNA-binding transcriptional LysR family regulator
MNVRVQDVRYFLAVAEELSFTRAAELLFVSQPALSKQIRQLEAQLRAELFTRGHRTVGLTPAGAAFLPRARAMLAEWEAATEDVRLAGRTLTVGFHSRIGRGLVPTITATMQQRLPGWQLQFRQVPWGDPAVGLTSGTVDVALAWLPVPAGLSTRRIATEERGVALPSAHRLAGRSSVRFAEIADEPFVALPASAGPMRDFWLAMAERTAPPTIAGEATTSDEAYEIVAAGKGLLLQPSGSCAIHQREDVVHRPVLDLPPADLAVVWRSGDRRPAVGVVTDACFHCASPPRAACGIMAG